MASLRGLFLTLLIACPSMDELDPGVPSLDQVAMLVDGVSLVLDGQARVADDRSADPKRYDPPFQITIAFDGNDGSKWMLNVQNEVGEQTLVRSYLPSASGAFLRMERMENDQRVTYYARDGDRLRVDAIDEVNSRVTISFADITMSTSCGEELQLSEGDLDLHMVTNEILDPADIPRFEEGADITWKDMGNWVQASVDGAPFDSLVFVPQWMENEDPMRSSALAINNCEPSVALQVTWMPEETPGTREVEIDDQLTVIVDNPNDGTVIAGKSVFWAHTGRQDLITNEGPGGIFVAEFPESITMYRVVRDDQGEWDFDTNTSVTVTGLFVRSRTPELP